MWNPLSMCRWWNIERNNRIADGKGGSDFYLDEGLLEKLESKWEEPSKEEVDVIYKAKRW